MDEKKISKSAQFLFDRLPSLVDDNGFIQKTSEELGKVGRIHPANVRLLMKELINAELVFLCGDTKGGRGNCNVYSLKKTNVKGCFMGNESVCPYCFHNLETPVKPSESPVNPSEKVVINPSKGQYSTIFGSETPVKGSKTPVESQVNENKSLAFTALSTGTMLAPLTTSVVYNDSHTKETKSKEQEQVPLFATDANEQPNSPIQGNKSADKNKERMASKKPASFILSASTPSKEKSPLRDIATLPEKYELAKVIGRYLALTNPRSKNKISDKELEMLTTPLVIKTGPNMGKSVGTLLEAFQKHHGAFEKFLTPTIMGELLKKHGKFPWWKTIVSELEYAFKSGELFRLTGYKMNQVEIIASAQVPVMTTPTVIRGEGSMLSIEAVLEGIKNESKTTL